MHILIYFTIDSSLVKLISNSHFLFCHHLKSNLKIINGLECQNWYGRSSYRSNMKKVKWLPLGYFLYCCELKIYNMEWGWLTWVNHLVKCDPLGHKRYKMSDFEWPGHVEKNTIIIFIFRWFKFTLKSPISIRHGKCQLAIWDTSF